MRNRVKSVVRPALFLSVVLAVLLFFGTGVSRVENSRTEEGLLQLEGAVRRAVVACYAAEGFYPPSLEYIQEHYGLQHDSGRYTVIYEVSGANLLPDITVIKRGQ